MELAYKRILLKISGEVLAGGKGMGIDYDTVLKEIRQRDYQDTHREIAPLKMARDSVKVDTSDMNLEQAVEAIRDIIMEKVAP